MLVPANAHTGYISLRTAPTGPPSQAFSFQEPRAMPTTFASGPMSVPVRTLGSRCQGSDRSVPPEIPPYPPKFICTFPHFLYMFSSRQLSHLFASSQRKEISTPKFICNAPQKTCTELQSLTRRNFALSAKPFPIPPPSCRHSCPSAQHPLHRICLLFN